jgi:hypothetical protein
MSANLHRRHLDDAQRKLAAWEHTKVLAEAEECLASQAPLRQAKESDDRRREHYNPLIVAAAKALSTTPGGVMQARMVTEHGTPALVGGRNRAASI